jgi:hypothetical protein
MVQLYSYLHSVIPLNIQVQLLFVFTILYLLLVGLNLCKNRETIVIKGYLWGRLNVIDSIA